MIGWAQSVDEPAIEQVGEDNEDPETLDEAGSLPAEVATDEDIETLDQGPPVGAQNEDVELLDLGPPAESTAAPATEPAPAAPVAAEPTTTYIVPESVAASGPVIPEGFGTGTVHVSTGSTPFPVGLEGCHVGAVTGRAYVGVDCGDGSSFVGQAPSFEEFPFVVDEGFPFNRESVFAAPSEDENSDNADIFVSASQVFPSADAAETPVIRTSGASSVEFAQKSRDRKPRTETVSHGSKPRADSSTRGNGRARADVADSRNDRTRTESKGKQSAAEQNKKSRSAARDGGEKSTKSKKQGANKGKKGRK